MNAHSTIAHDASTQAPLSAQILAGVFADLPEHYSDAEWIEAAQEAHDEGDEAALLRMVEVGEFHDQFVIWQRSATNEREADRRQFLTIEDYWPLQHDYLKLVDAGYRRGWAA